MNLTHVMCSKASGKSICASADVDRLVEIRTVSVASLFDIIKIESAQSGLHSPLPEGAMGR